MFILSLLLLKINYLSLGSRPLTLRYINSFLVFNGLTFENVCCLAYETSSFSKMRFFIMFITAVCLIFLIKLRWPKTKSLYFAQHVLEIF